jgi:hypothetical protein
LKSPYPMPSLPVQRRNSWYTSQRLTYPATAPTMAYTGLTGRLAVPAGVHNREATSPLHRSGSVR